MQTKVKAGNGKVIVSVEHPATTPTVRVQRLATRELNKYRTDTSCALPGR